MNQTQWQVRFKAWQDFCATIHHRANAADAMRHERGWKIAEAAGLPRNLCCIHNASLDDSFTGWCADAPSRLKAAKAALHYLNDWRGARLADRIIYRAYDRLMNDDDGDIGDYGVNAGSHIDPSDLA